MLRSSRPPTFPAPIDPSATTGADEIERCRLITEISKVIREPSMPEATRMAGLTLIGWLARRMPGEAPHAIGVEEARRDSRVCTIERNAEPEVATRAGRRKTR